MKELADMVAESLGVKNPEINYEDWMPGDIKVFDIDNSLIKNELGIDFVTDFQKGLDLTIDWARKYFERQGVKAA